ncbi:hypothetical protein fHeYen901_147 [Yersinia phage fHe-Yen9-01]|uniref:Uncharacterized protein n=1 Tax=Yersinia phage fHe-Yen9-01 TaxID=1965363 RepID=A0A1V0DXP7_9CAUD|nr:hypothetical protein KNT60_gp146 [Yersinia phage fHe-Yen9-01]ARB05920.1 hypothetical protein fHeYen901_147 [Yersinia phage fHe-Yen9-01]
MERTKLPISYDTESGIGVCIAVILTLSLAAGFLVLEINGPNVVGITILSVFISWVLAFFWSNIVEMIYYFPARLRNRKLSKMLQETKIKMKHQHEKLAELEAVNEFVTYCRGNK